MSMLIDSIIKLTLAAVLGGIVGLEREVSHKPAGLRTNILICAGSTLFMIISRLVSVENLGGDPGRIAAQVVTGIGFLGAGAIMQSRGSVVGLTTGASIFIVAAIGLAVGAGYWIPAAVGTAVALVSLVALTRLERVMRTKPSLVQYVLVAERDSDALNELEKVLEDLGLTMEEVSYDRVAEGRFRLSFSVLAKAELNRQLRRRLFQLRSAAKVESPRAPE